MPKKCGEVESFALDHTRVQAPYVRKCAVLHGTKGDVVTKFDLRFTQPNKTEMKSDGMHTLEHLLAVNLRDGALDIIDLSPMGCHTGFYLSVWGEPSEGEVSNELKDALLSVVDAKEIPGATPVQCGNAKLHSLQLAQKYAEDVLNRGFVKEYIV